MRAAVTLGLIAMIAALAGYSGCAGGEGEPVTDGSSDQNRLAQSHIYSVNAGPHGMTRESFALLDQGIAMAPGSSVRVRVRVDRAASSAATAGLYYRDNGGDFYHFGVFPAQGRARVFDSRAGWNVASAYAEDPYRFGQWYTLEAVAGDGIVRMFVDGVEVTQPGGLPFTGGEGSLSLRVRDSDAVFADLEVVSAGGEAEFAGGWESGGWSSRDGFAWGPGDSGPDGGLRGTVMLPVGQLISEEVSPDFSRQFELLGEAGVSQVRLLVLWQDIQAEDPDVYYWDRMDALVISARENGIGVLAVLLNAPAWAVSPEHRREGDFYAFPPVDNGDVDRFTRAAVARYRPGGALAREQGWEDGYGVTDYEVGTEFNAGRLVVEGRQAFSGWLGSLEQYVDYLKVSHDAIKAECPGCLVVSGAAADDVMPYYEAQTDPTGERQYVWQGVEDLYAEIGSRHPGDPGAADRYFDVMNIHTYQWRTLAGDGATPDTARYYGFPDELWYRDRISNTLAVMEKYGDGDKELWLTETAYASRDNGDASRGFLTETGQAEALAMVYREAGAFPQVRRVYWWHAFDTRIYSGLLSLPASPKDSYWMFAYLTGMRDTPVAP